TSSRINVAPSMLANVVWKWKEAQSQHETGSSTCRSSLPAVFAEQRHASPRNLVECDIFWALHTAGAASPAYPVLAPFRMGGVGERVSFLIHTRPRLYSTA